jgi:hypothetical protein
MTGHFLQRAAWSRALADYNRKYAGHRVALSVLQGEQPIGREISYAALDGLRVAPSGDGMRVDLFVKDGVDRVCESLHDVTAIVAWDDRTGSTIRIESRRGQCLVVRLERSRHAA